MIRFLLRHWQVAGDVSDIPAHGDWLAFDMLGEGGVVMRGQDGVVRAFHNLCRYRGAHGRRCAGPLQRALACPFHGWVYNMDSTLRGAAVPTSFGALDRSRFGLKPVEMELFPGVIFLRFHPGPQPGVTRLTGRLYRHPNETRQQRLARYLAYRIDRKTADEDQQLSIRSNQSMKSQAFEGLHLSDPEYGVRRHHDGLRRLLPVMLNQIAPKEGEVAVINAEMLGRTKAVTQA